MKECLIILSLCFASVFAGLGPCPQLTDAKPLNVEKFTGTWYVLADTMSYAGTSECGKMLITKIDESKLNLTHTYSQVGHHYVTEGDFEPMWSSKRIFNFKNKDNYVRHYWIVGTDYDTWSLLYVCSQTSIAHSVAGFLLSRQNNEQCLSMVQKYTIKQAMKQVRGWRTINFHYHNQNGCH